MTFKIGFHVSIAGGIHNSVSRALKIGCTAFQIFTRNPRGWKETKITEDDIELFKSNLKESGIQKDCVAVLLPYMPNLSGSDGEMYEKSINSFTNELIKCSQLGIEYLIIRLGSHRGEGKDNGIKQVVKSCHQAVYNYKSAYGRKLNVTVLLKNNWGAKNSTGSSLEELREILDRLPDKRYGICLDTCNAFVSGYDLRNETVCNEFIDRFDGIVGIKMLKFVHLNDSKDEIGSHIDRHWHIGLAKIGIEGLKAIINNKSLKDLPMVMETPVNSIRDELKNMEMVLRLRTKFVNK